MANDYPELHWETLDALKEQLFARLQHPINEAIDNIQQSPESSKKQLRMLQNMVDAWATLVAWKRDATSLKADQFEVVDLTNLPGWVRSLLSRRASLKIEPIRTVVVHPSTFFEALTILVDFAEKVGHIHQIMMSEASLPRNGVWIRIVFEPPTEQYQSKVAIMDTLVDHMGTKIPVQFELLNDLLGMNQTRFSLQNNTRTGHQAFAVFVPSVPPTELPAVRDEQSLEFPRYKEPASQARTKNEKREDMLDITRPMPPIVLETEDIPDDQATLPLPTVSIHEKADAVDRIDDILTKVQDVLMDYAGTAELSTKPEQIVSRIYELLQAASQNIPEATVDRDTLMQVYNILNTSPVKLKQHTPSPEADRARMMLGALYQLLFSSLIDAEGRAIRPNQASIDASQNVSEPTSQPVNSSESR